MIFMIFTIDMVMVSFMCPLDWGTGYPVICSYTVLGVSQGCFQMRSVFESVDSAKQIALPDVGSLHQLN